MVDQVGSAESCEVVCEDGRIVLTPVHPGATEAVRAQLAEMGLSETDVVVAVRWARQA